MPSLGDDIQALNSNMDRRFKILSGLWIILMQGGFAFLEAGSVRSKNTTSILFKNVLNLFAGTIVYWGFGYAFAYGKPSNGFIGYGNFFATNLFTAVEDISTNTTSTTKELTLSQDYFPSFFLTLCYATSAATIGSSAMAERVRSPVYLVNTVAVTGFIYPVIAHWVWDESGWLRSNFGLRFIDHAGSGVVHVTGGICALVGAYHVGPRIGRFSKSDLASPPMQGHSVPLACLGGFLLLNGFLAFNAASQRDIYGIYETGLPLIVVNTVLSSSTGAFSALIVNSVIIDVRKIKASKYSLLTLLNGFLGGLVAVCAGSNQIRTWASFITGFLGGASVILWKALITKWKIDDPVDAAAVHLGAGLVGVLTVPVWAVSGQERGGKFVGGILYGADSLSFQGYGWNLLGTICILVWAGGLSSILFYMMKRFQILRVKDSQEIEGIDLSHHGEPAYPESSLSTNRKQ